MGEKSKAAQSQVGLRLLVCGGAIALIWWVASPVLAQTAPDDSAWGYALAHEMMSPFCPGRTLAACTSPQAAEVRQWILLQESAGASREEVMELLEQRFGASIRSTPEAEGWGLAAWSLPAVALAVGALLLTLALRRMVVGSRPGPEQSAESSSAERSGSFEDEDLMRRVDQELAAHDR